MWEASPPLSRRFTDIRGIFHHSSRKSEFKVVFVFLMTISRLPARTNFEHGVIFLFRVLSCLVWQHKKSDSEKLVKFWEAVSCHWRQPQSSEELWIGRFTQEGERLPLYITNSFDEVVCTKGILTGSAHIKDIKGRVSQIQVQKQCLRIPLCVY